jgi:hypothetical protein
MMSAAVLVALIAAGCGDDNDSTADTTARATTTAAARHTSDSTGQSDPASTATTPSPSGSEVDDERATEDPQQVLATPSSASPGDTIELSFMGDQERGTLWEMRRIEGGAVNEPEFFLTVASDGYDCPLCPTWVDSAGDVEVEDIALTGRGPDIILVPTSATDGVYRLCQSDGAASRQPCVEIAVVVE